VAGGFAVLPGHAQGGTLPDPAPYARVDTLVVLMGVGERARIAAALIRAGRRPGEPVAFVENGSTPEERVVTATLGRVAEGGVEVRPPAVWVIGEVVRVRERLEALERAVAGRERLEAPTSQPHQTSIPKEVT
ncbi:SAM-dependent methyltransferase, partial [Calidithermus terrae]|uniref:SAM-dependent methyltransferase n=1 Tax=Calidithermus terrae TaxID=1408545 RepID=UPI001FE5C406